MRTRVGRRPFRIGSGCGYDPRDRRSLPMTAFRPLTELETHAVENQPPERGDLDLWAGDLPLREAAGRAGAGDRSGALAAFGAAAGA